MTSSNPWWKGASEPAAAAHPAAPAPETPRAEKPLAEKPFAEAPRVEAHRAETQREPDVAGNSLGEAIDQAIGDFDARLARMRELLEEKRSEIRELEVEIAEAEKNQARAFKDLLSHNPHIRRMLHSKPRRKPSMPRPRTSGPARSEPAVEDPFKQ